MLYVGITLIILALTLLVAICGYFGYDIKLTKDGLETHTRNSASNPTTQNKD